MLVKFELRTDTSIRWLLTNPVLREGEPGFEKDTYSFKLGDGVSPWSDLEYFIDKAGVIELIETIAGSGSSDADIAALISDLGTDTRDALVDAVNEISSPSIPFTTLYTNAKAG